MATIKDVAERAGVSVATVSRVLNTPDAVKERTRQQVLNAIDELQYSPNFLGRNLRMMETKRILVVLNTTISNQFFPESFPRDRGAGRGGRLCCHDLCQRGEISEFAAQGYVRYATKTRAVDGMILTTHEGSAMGAIFTLSGRFPRSLRHVSRRCRIAPPA
ncbi:MAG: LacI family DNA-binding transcriptional regulator [Clostridia bacterium]